MKKKSVYRVTNWSEYNASLKQRGSLTIWLSDDFEQSWYAVSKDNPERGRPFIYSEHCLNLMLTLRHIFKLALRQLIGFVESLLRIMGKDLSVPDYSRLSKRSTKRLPRLHRSAEAITHIVMDSTGLKVFGEKEWLMTKYGHTYQRKVWRKLHICIDQKGYILSKVLTDHKTDDRVCVSSLLTKINIARATDMLADSGYDSHGIYQECEQANINPIIPPPSHAALSNKASSTKRNEAVEYIKNKGYWAWYYKNDFGRRNKVENTFYRLKTIFGRKLMSRKITNQQIETNIICNLLNKMTDLGMPKSIKIS